MGVYNHYESCITSVERVPPRKDYKPSVLTLYWTTPYGRLYVVLHLR